MRREHGICIVSKEELETSGFQGIVIPKVYQEFDILYVKESFWKNGQYKEQNLFKTELPEGSGMEKLKEVIYGEYNHKKDFGTVIMPEIFVEEKVAKFIGQ